MYRMMLGMTASLLSVASQAAMLTALKRETADGHDDYRIPYAVNVGMCAIVGFFCVVTTLATVEEKNKGKKCGGDGGESDSQVVEVGREEPQERGSVRRIRNRHSEKSEEGDIEIPGDCASVGKESAVTESGLESASSDEIVGEEMVIEAEVPGGRGEFSMKNAIGELLHNLKDTLSNRAFLLIVLCYTCAWVSLPSSAAGMRERGGALVSTLTLVRLA